MFITVDAYTNRVTIDGNVRRNDNQIEYTGPIPDGYGWIWNPDTETIELGPEHYRMVIVEEAREALKFLNETDWKVTRHRDQLDLGEPTSLTEEDFAQLLADRQAARVKVREPESLIPPPGDDNDPGPQVDYD